MKSPDPQQTITELLSDALIDQAGGRSLVKVCGFTKASDVEVALQNSVNLIGVIFAQSKRGVSDEQARDIAAAVRRYGERNGRVSSFEAEVARLRKDKLSPKLWYERCSDLLRKTTLRQPLTVGVFQDQPLELVNLAFPVSPLRNHPLTNLLSQINEKVASLGLDVVQLHGSESPEFAEGVSVPCIKVVHTTPAEMGTDSHGRLLISFSFTWALL